jgi:hypothetical protein
MEGSELIIMQPPIFLPLVTKYGIDPVHFGLVFIIAATIGNYTPPVGGAMFLVCRVSRCPIFVPAVVLFVPDLPFGKRVPAAGAQRKVPGSERENRHEHEERDAAPHPLSGLRAGA